MCAYVPPYVKNFEKLAFGLFVHFGLYSAVKKGEWHLRLDGHADVAGYEKLTDKFVVAPNWSEEIVRAAKSAGCRYVVLTTRHHDGFSLYDAKGLSDYDAPHSACGRDLVAEFVGACRKEGLIPFFYHTLLDWRCPEYNDDFPAYIDYLVKSVELLCTNYGKIGGFWFDGMWDKPDGDWQEDRLYSTIRKRQPEAMIINNTGLSELGKVGHYEIDSVTFERGKPRFVDNTDKYRAGEMCQVMNDHWGYCEDDIDYKPVKELIADLIDCRGHNCNFLLNVGPLPDGTLRDIDRCYLGMIGKWINSVGNFIYDARAAEIVADGATVFDVGGKYYAAVKGVGMIADVNVQRGSDLRCVTFRGRKIKSAFWVDDGSPADFDGDKLVVRQFAYGKSMCVRVACVSFI